MDADGPSDGRQPERQPERRRPTRVVVADDHPLFLSALRELLDREADFEVVAEASDGQQALELCRRLRPEVLVVDVHMPRMDGLETTRAVRREFPRTIVMVLTAYDDPDSLSEALKAGAAGFLLKTSPPAEIVEAVRKVLTGESPLSTEVATQLLMRLVDLVEKQPRDAPKEQRLLESLTPREDEVLQLMVAGQTNQQIASKLLVSTSTVKKHVHSVISKLEVSDRTQAAVMALELGVRPEQRKD